MLFASDWQIDNELAAAHALPAHELFARAAFDFLTRGESVPALECAVSGTSSFPDYATGWFVRAKAEWQLNLEADALSSVERCLSLEPTFFTAWDLLATLHERAGRETAARAARQRLEELLHGAAVPFGATPEKVTPRPVATPTELSPVRSSLVLVKPASFETPTLAEVYRRQGLLDRALEVYRRILERHPDDTGALAMVHKLEDELASRHPTVGAA